MTFSSQGPMLQHQNDEKGNTQILKADAVGGSEFTIVYTSDQNEIPSSLVNVNNLRWQLCSRQTGRKSQRAVGEGRISSKGGQKQSTASQN